jgi:glycosyltransferase involved in cell wall biosynthesis
VTADHATAGLDGPDGPDGPQRPELRGRLQSASLALVVPFLDAGPVESHVVAQAVAMRPAVGRLEVCCFARVGKAAADLRAAGVDVQVLGVDPAARDRVARYRLWHHLRSTRPDIVHARTGALTAETLAAARKAGVAVRVADEAGPPAGDRAGRRRTRHTYRAATHVVAPSDAAARHLVDDCHLPAAKVARVHDMVDDRYLAGGRRRPAGTGELLTVGRLVPEKGHDLLVRAAAPILRSARRARLRIAGDGPEERALVTLARELGVGGQVELLGFRTDVAPLLATADLFVLPSRSEGSGLALVEAMAMRVPVIATEVGGVPEILEVVAPDWMVPPDDPDALTRALARALALGDRSKEILTERLHARAAEFTVAHHVAALEGLYADALSR